MILPAIIAVSGAAVSWVLTFPAIRILAGMRALDVPNNRSSHVAPVPRGGGIVIVLIFASVLIYFGFLFDKRILLLALGVVLVAVVSFIDDLISLSAWARLLAHFIAAFCALYWVSKQGPAPFGIPSLLAAVFAVVWIVSYINIFNFMDGINGLAVGQLIISSAGIAAVAHCEGLPWSHPAVILSIVLGGSALGFLPHNFPVARVFLGDVGSATFGLILASLTLWVCYAAGWSLLLPLMTLHINFILDAAITLVRRFLRGERIQDAHNEHFYQRLVRSGRPHYFVTSCEMLIQCAIVGLLILTLPMGVAPVLAVTIIAIFVWAAFFRFSESAFRARSENGSAR
jgi:UDP-N-acetylmuramyl pentapeptide phosphotransferase/UDP-N-acetylglucosamine-1-phosphate transferase